MMTSLGHEVYLYGGSQNTAQVKEFIPVVPEELYKEWFGEKNWENEVFSDWNADSPCWVGMNSRAIQEIQKRKQPGDILGIISGVCQLKIKNAFPDLRCVEWGIGYPGIILDAFHVFESNAWMHYLYGKYGVNDGRFFDAVIPNSFDEEDYIYRDKKEDYLLYLGRPTARKGLEVIQQLAMRGHKIITAGQGNPGIEGVEHVGIVRGEKKAELLANAKALLAPTFYIEPFGGVAVEAMLSGTPVISTDFGAFTETVIEGQTGYRCHTLGEFETAAQLAEGADHSYIRFKAEQYLTRYVRFRYDDYFKRLALLDGAGWYA